MQLKDKVFGVGNRSYYFFHRPDIAKVIILNFNRIASKVKDEADKLVLNNFIIAGYNDLERYIDEKLSKFDINSKIGTKAYVSEVKKGIGKVSLTQEECINMITHVLDVTNHNPATIYGVLERSLGSRDSLDMGGLICLYGGSGSGKTTFLDLLAGKANATQIHAPIVVTSEPVARAVPLNRGLTELICHIIAFEGQTCIAFDSFRGIVYGSGGSTLSGGVSAAMLEVTMNISRLASLCSKLVLGVINPLNADEDKNKTLVEALLGSTTGLVMFNKGDYNNVAFSHRFMNDRSMRSISKEVLAEHFLRAELVNTDAGILNNTVARSGQVDHISTISANTQVAGEVEEQLHIVTTEDAILKATKF